MIPREIVHSLVAVYGWYKPVEDVLFTIGVIPREIVHSLVLFMVSVSLSEIFVHYWCDTSGDSSLIGCCLWLVETCRRCFVHYCCDTLGDSSLIGAVYGWWKPVGDICSLLV